MSNEESSYRAAGEKATMGEAPTGAAGTVAKRGESAQGAPAGGVESNTAPAGKKYGLLEKLSGGNTRLVLKSSLAEFLNGLASVIGVTLTYIALGYSVGRLVDGQPVDFGALWIICLCFIPTVALCILTETFAYNTTYLNAYRISARGRA